MSSLLMMLWSVGCVPVLTSPKDSADQSCWETVDNNWVAQTPRTGLEASGFGIGETPPNMCMTDQFGNNVSLWQFYEQLILLNVSSEWSGASQILASGVEQIWTDYRNRKFMYLTLLTEDVLFDTPSVETLEQWSNHFSITAPVLSDSEGYREQLVPTGTYPTLILINRNMEVIIDYITPVNEETARSAPQ